MNRLVVAMVLLCTLPVLHAQQSATVLFTGARFITLDARTPVAEAVLVSHGRIRTVFAKAPAAAPKGARSVDLSGAVVVPGLHDAHLHLAGLGESEINVDLSGTRSAQDVVARVAERLKTHQGQILFGRGWDQNDWTCAEPAVAPCGGTMPDRALLDAVSLEKPIYLRRIDGHAAWMNSAALKLAGPDALGVDPPGGRILRDGKNTPSGVLVDGAMELVSSRFPVPTPKDIEERVTRGAARARAAGLTAVHDMGTTPAELDAMRALDRRGELPVRVFVYLDGMDPRVLDQLPAGGPREGEGHVEVRGVKLYADGALGSRGAALLAPYADEPGTSGLLVTPSKVLEEKTRAVDARGFQVAIHAIGDKGNREVLELFARLRTDARQRRHRVEHAQVVNPADWGAFKALNVVASMQPTHATSDMPWAEKRLGPERIKGAYAWKSLQQAGATLALGSDAPVESELPLLGLYAARTRQDHEGKPAAGWRAAEALDGMEALRGFTTGAAWAVGHEKDLGVIREGARADFTVLEGDPVTLDPGALLKLRVLGTWLDGVKTAP